MRPVVVFLGPTLAHDEARTVLDAEFLPPAAHGDVLRAALRRPQAIGIVDGVFEHAPAVWHKEVLFALSEGIHVYGAASMGALRAAELDRFGMRGIGEIYRAYAEGVLEDDDEVAVAHAGVEDGFRAMSDPMVDIRATLDAAVSNGIASERTAATIAAQIKATFYPKRSLLGALSPHDDDHLPLREWLPDGWVRRKRDDALALLRTIAGDLEAGLEPFRPNWTLQRTRSWEDARHSVERASGHRPGSAPAVNADEELESVLDEARLDPDRYGRLLDEALLVALARDGAAAVGVDVSSWAHQAALDRERHRRGLSEPEDVSTWLGKRGLSMADVPAVAQRLAVLRWAHDAHRDAVAGEVAFTLRSDDVYAELVARAAHKREVLASLPGSRAREIDDRAAISWYFGEHLGRAVPVEVETWASANGWQRVTDFVRAIRAEWRFQQATSGGGSTALFDLGSGDGADSGDATGVLRPHDSMTLD